ncbi:O-acyltransferase WSD1-like [Gossypium australe]|uniref:O-acyltransferase WSD1-like n=1 Tax=Gossypium australe TaxID=47621 RepID=A0A5B6UY63_9ROSI|nr:O-acyltransferase WSD1-like [Gossypium australe]
MESGNELKWRKQALKPIDTTRRSSSSKREEKTGEEEPLSPSPRLFHDSNFNIYGIAIMGCKTRIYPDVFKANLSHTLLRHPRFSSLQVMDERNKGEMKWVRTQVDLEKHVIVPKLDPNIDSPEKFLEDYIYNLSKTSINESQPLWDLHLLNLRTSESEAVGVFRIHHSLGDGTSLMSLLLACTRQMNDPLALPTVFLNTVVDVFMFIATALFLKDTQNPLKGPPGAEFAPRRIVYRTVSLDDIKLVKNAMNTTINDVALGITQAGLSRYINRIYGGNNKDEGAIEMDNLPKKIRLRSTLLINVRPSAGIQALADMMEKDGKAKWGNWIGYVLLLFTVAIRDDQLEYVRDAKATIDRKKRSLEAIFTFSIAELALKLFGVKVNFNLSNYSFVLAASLICPMLKTDVCFSNLVGPLEEIGFYGHPMAFLAPSSYGLLHALLISFQSYIDKMTIVVSVDEGTIPNPHQLCDDIVESLRHIKHAVVTKGLA